VPTLGRVLDRDEFPPDGASDFEWLLFRQKQVLTRAQAVAAIGRSALRNRLARRYWQRPERAVVVTHNGTLTRDQRIWVALLAAGPGAVCAGRTALALGGLRGYDEPRIHVLIPARRQVVTPTGTAVHRTVVLPPEHMRAGPPGRTTVARSIFDAAAWARTDDDARAMTAAAFQQRLVGLAAIERIADLLPRSRRRGLVLQTAGYAAGGAHSLSEVDLVRLCRRYRLPRPDQQVSRTDGSGRQRYLDAYWRPWGLHVEVDGAFHLEVRAWWDDMRRQNELWIAGDRVLRFPAWVVATRPAEVATQIRAALAASGRRDAAQCW
jgi:hypothetical protein